MQGVDVPVRVVWGIADKVLKSAEFIEVPGARTFVQLDAPALVADQIASFSSAGHARDI